MERVFPFPAFPNGWFVVSYSDELDVGQVKPIEYFGKDLVLFRGEDGEARVLDAHCRHLGAHLGYGGCVEGDAIRCPVHAWKWDGDGVCVDIPYAKHIPSKARTTAWDVCERNGSVFAWFHAEGEPPDYEIPVVPEVSDEEWEVHTRHSWNVESRMYDMGENAVDHQHFIYLHGAGGIPTLDQVTDEDGARRNVSQMDMTTPQGPIKGSIESKGYGPGYGVVYVGGIVDTIIINEGTPVDDENVEVRFTYLQRKTDDERQLRIGTKMIKNLLYQMDQDQLIFKHKTYLTKPLVLKEDGPILKYRREARKAYSGPFWDD